MVYLVATDIYYGPVLSHQRGMNETLRYPVRSKNCNELPANFISYSFLDEAMGFSSGARNPGVLQKLD
jgi:hypothetical protein